jgi:hypothetical protein
VNPELANKLIAPVGQTLLLVLNVIVGLGKTVTVPVVILVV